MTCRTHRSFLFVCGSASKRFLPQPVQLGAGEPIVPYSSVTPVWKEQPTVIVLVCKGAGKRRPGWGRFGYLEQVPKIQISWVKGRSRSLGWKGYSASTLKWGSTEPETRGRKANTGPDCSSQELYEQRKEERL